MTITAPTIFVSGTNKASGTSNTTSATVPAGSLIVLATYNWNITGNAATGTVSDSAGNAYLLAKNSAATTSVLGTAIYYTSSAKSIASGGTVTFTPGDGNNYAILGLFSQGCNGGVDATNASATATSTTALTLTSGGLKYIHELIVGVCEPVTAGSSVIPGNGFTQLSSVVGLGFASLIVASTVSVTYLSSWTTASAVSGVVASFQETPTVFNQFLDDAVLMAFRAEIAGY